MAGARGAVLRVGRPAQRRLQARAGRHEPLSRRLQQPESGVPAALRAGDPGGGRARVPRCARRAARAREPHAQHVLSAERRDAAEHPAPGGDARAPGLAHPGPRDAPRRSTCPTGGSLTLEPIVRTGRRVGLADFDPCMVLLNNDLSAGAPADPRRHRPADRAAARRRLVQPQEVASLRASSIASRRSSRRCSASTRGSSIRTSASAARSTSRSAPARNASRRTCRSCSSRSAPSTRNTASTEKPFVIVKADAGTYGMGIMTVRDASEVTGLNRKQRNKMAVVKEGLEVIVGHRPGRRADVRVDPRRDRRAGRLHDRPLRRRRLLPRARGARQGREPERAGRAVRAARVRVAVHPRSRASPPAARPTASTRTASSRASRSSRRRSRSRSSRSPRKRFPPNARTGPAACRASASTRRALTARAASSPGRLVRPSSASPADARCRRPWRDTGSRGACTPACWRCSRVPASPAPRAGRPTTAARATRTNAAACADGRGATSPCRTAQSASRRSIARGVIRLPLLPTNSAFGIRVRHARAHREPRADGLERRGADRNDPLLRALAPDADFAGGEIDAIGIEPREFGEAQSRRIGELEQRPVAHGKRIVAGDLDQAHRLVGRERGREFPDRLGRLQSRARILLHRRVAVLQLPKKTPP